MRKTDVPYEIRWARPEEWSPAMRMIWRTFLKFEGKDYTKEGIKNFYNFITDADLYESFLKGTYLLMVALDGDKIVGAGSLRNHNHLSLLFVDEAYHHRKIGSAIMEKLCVFLRDEQGERYMSLNSSPYAVGFYRTLGFRAIAPEESYSGIRVTSMELIF
ncbi:MAG: GNAT family N-acetyltransferase [Acetatifactor sp.]|jgi:ribosomal protein S18 acetylase RimI-like enzyme|nr:GNAT family N-acetyltransferase [Acetatifactor sp.]